MPRLYCAASRQPAAANLTRLVDSPVAVIGGSGALGFGLALRLGHAGVPIVIGSRSRPAATSTATPTARPRGAAGP